jgi:hypothetical protein
MIIDYMLSLQDLIDKIPMLNKVTINDWIPTYESYLGMAVHFGHKNSVQRILELEGNPNGITSSGLSQPIPMTRLLSGHTSPQEEAKIFWTLIPVLLKGKANINGEDLRGNTVLTNAVTRFVSLPSASVNLIEEYQKIIVYLLAHGSNPNGTIFQNPLYILSVVTNTKFKKQVNEIMIF